MMAEGGGGGSRFWLAPWGVGTTNSGIGALFGRSGGGWGAGGGLGGRWRTQRGGSWRAVVRGAGVGWLGGCLSAVVRCTDAGGGVEAGVGCCGSRGRGGGGDQGTGGGVGGSLGLLTLACVRWNERMARSSRSYDIGRVFVCLCFLLLGSATAHRFGGG